VSRPQGRTWLVVRAAVIVAVLGPLAVATGVWTDTLGAGRSFESLVTHVTRIIPGSSSGRVTPPAVTVTPRPAHVTPAPTLPARGPTSGPVTPTPTVAPTPTRPPVRTRIDLVVVGDPAGRFASQAEKDWCAPAAVQMVLAALGRADTSVQFQQALAGRIREWEAPSDSRNGGWGPSAMVDALAAYGAHGYEVRAYDTRADALRDSAVALAATGSPVVLLAWRGAHAWVMIGYRSDADPAIFPDAVVSGAYILDPWYPRISTLWGPSDPPGTFQDSAEMVRNFLPWRRPEGRYPDRDGKFLAIAPTLPSSAAAGEE
jgi:hypothetical protein